jgi:hypothetical protein
MYYATYASFNYTYNYFRKVKENILSLFTRYSTATLLPLTIRKIIRA